MAVRNDTAASHLLWNLVRGTPFAGSQGYLDNEPEVDVDIVEAAHEDGRTVNVWIVDMWYRAGRLTDAGVDGLIADYLCRINEEREIRTLRNQSSVASLN